MTLQIVVISTLNIALGYGLAIYLGHGQLPWKSVRKPSLQDASSSASLEPSTDDPAAVSLDRLESKTNLKAGTVEKLHVQASGADPMEQAAVTQQQESSENESQVATPEPISAMPEDSAPEVDSTPAQPVAEQTSTEPSASADAESPQAGIDPAAEQVGSDNETSTTPDEAAEAELPVAEQEPAEESLGEQVDDSLLEGIEAFQQQLQSQAQESDPSEDEQEPVEMASPGQAADEVAPASLAVDSDEASEGDTSHGDDVLAGIESFRAQLDEMRASVSDSQSDEAAEQTSEEKEPVT